MTRLTLSTLDAAAAPRVRVMALLDPGLGELIGRMVDVSIAGLPSMLEAARGLHVHTVRRNPGGAVARHGVSPRYTSIVLLGARTLDPSVRRRVLGDHDADVLLDRVAADASVTPDEGDLALATWACAEAGHPAADDLADRLATMLAADAETVPAAWAVSALVASGRVPEAREAVARLMRAHAPAARLFRHATGPGAGLRGQVACFADQVYPVQALARYHALVGSPAGLRAANGVAASICDLQGPGGQWWWHYDARRGGVVEGYPVYSVHQDAMAPMALLDLAEAGGDAHADAVAAGLRWMDTAPEVGVSLIDDPTSVIWRKVGRREPRKLVRRMRAVSARTGWSGPAMQGLFPPRRIEHESRPYHLGWLLYAWLSGSSTRPDVAA